MKMIQYATEPEPGDVQQSAAAVEAGAVVHSFKGFLAHSSFTSLSSHIQHDVVIMISGNETFRFLSKKNSKSKEFASSIYEPTGINFVK